MVAALPSVPGGRGRQNSIGPWLIVLRNLFEIGIKKTSNPDREITLETGCPVVFGWNMLSTLMKNRSTLPRMFVRGTYNTVSLSKFFNFKTEINTWKAKVKELHSWKSLFVSITLAIFQME